MQEQWRPTDLNARTVKAYYQQCQNNEGLLTSMQEQCRPADLNGRTVQAYCQQCKNSEGLLSAMEEGSSAMYILVSFSSLMTLVGNSTGCENPYKPHTSALGDPALQVVKRKY